MKNRKINLRLKKFTDTSWCLQWRIDPQELGWFRRKFNFWKNVKISKKTSKKVMPGPYLFLCRTEIERRYSLSKFEEIKKSCLNEQDLERFKED